MSPSPIKQLLVIWMTSDFPDEVRRQYDTDVVLRCEHQGTLNAERAGDLIAVIEDFYGKKSWLSPLQAAWRSFLRLLALNSQGILFNPGLVVLMQGELFGIDEAESRLFFRNLRSRLGDYAPLFALGVTGSRIEQLRRIAYESGIDIIVPKMFDRRQLDDEVSLRLRMDADRSRPRRAMLLAWLASVLIPLCVTLLTLVIKEWATIHIMCPLASSWGASIVPGATGKLLPEDNKLVNGSYWQICTLEISNQGSLPLQGFTVEHDLADYGLKTDLPEKLSERIEVGKSCTRQFVIEVPPGLPSGLDFDKLRVKVHGPDGWWTHRPEPLHLPARVAQFLRSRQSPARGGTTPAPLDQHCPG